LVLNLIFVIVSYTRDVPIETSASRPRSKCSGSAASRSSGSASHRRRAHADLPSNRLHLAISGKPGPTAAPPAAGGTTIGGPTMKVERKKVVGVA
jgi:hypothetical protein